MCLDADSEWTTERLKKARWKGYDIDETHKSQVTVGEKEQRWSEHACFWTNLTTILG